MTNGVAAYYDRLAPVYGDGALFAARRKAVLDVAAREIASARRVLDLGCGNGAFIGSLREAFAGALVTGLDLSPEMIRAARRRTPSEVPLVRGDACAAPFRGGSFDVVLMSHVLVVVSDVESCLHEVARCLAPGGTLIATVGAGQWRAALAAVLGPDDMLQLAGLFGRLRTPDDGNAEAACAAAGLVPRSRQAPFTAEWHDVEQWLRIRWFGGLDEAARAQAESWADDVRTRASGHRLELAESVLVACKPR